MKTSASLILRWHNSGGVQDCHLQVPRGISRGNMLIKHTQYLFLHPISFLTSLINYYLGPTLVPLLRDPIHQMASLVKFGTLELKVTQVSTSMLAFIVNLKGISVDYSPNLIRIVSFHPTPSFKHFMRLVCEEQT